jgi:hypothetical protein
MARLDGLPYRRALSTYARRVKILREEPVVMTVFQMVDLWESGCRCPARAAGMSEADEREVEPQAMVSGILVMSNCAVHDPEHADELWTGGEVPGVLAVMLDGVQVLAPSIVMVIKQPEPGMAGRLMRCLRLAFRR